MCVIAAIPQKSDRPTHEELARCWRSNSDGGGFMFVTEDDELFTFKSMDWEEFVRTFDACYDQYGEDSPFVLHMRIATHGTVDLFNCHPFNISDNISFAHNGILSGYNSKSLLSDTQQFNEEILKTLPMDWWVNEGIMELLEELIGWGNKMVFLTNNKELLFLHRQQGEWHKGVWYSNSSYKSFTLMASGWGGTRGCYSDYLGGTYHDETMLVVPCVQCSTDVYQYYDYSVEKYVWPDWYNETKALCRLCHASTTKVEKLKGVCSEEDLHCYICGGHAREVKSISREQVGIHSKMVCVKCKQTAEEAGMTLFDMRIMVVH